MRDAGASRRYATALVKLAVEGGQEEAILAELTAWNTLFAGEGAELFRVLSSPVFGAEERRAVLGEVAGKAKTSDLLVRFMSLLIDRDRMVGFPDIVRHVTADLDARAGRIRVAVRSAAELDDGMKAELTAAFEKSTGKTVLLETEIDPDLLGGLVARIGSKVYDASLRTRLHDLKHRLIHGQAPAQA